jgi:ribonuclease HI
MPFTAIKLVQRKPTQKPVQKPARKLPARMAAISRIQNLLYFDGGAKPNPGQMRCCVAITSVPTEYIFRYLNYGTNNVAEWYGLILAVRIAIDRQFDNVAIYGDSQLVINQAKGLWRINVDEHRALYREFCQLRDKIDQCVLHQVPRENNLAGNYLEHH